MRGAFATTHWTVVLNAGDPAAPATLSALTQLCSTYWPPLYAFLRRQGRSPHDAQDLVQGFFERLLTRDFLGHVDRDKGRFRSFLLSSLKHYVANVDREARTQRRGGIELKIPLDEPGVLERCEEWLTGQSSPELGYDQAWAETILDQATRRLREEYEKRGKTGVYEVLLEWLVREAGPGEYERVAPRLRMTEGALAGAVFRLRRRFRELIRAEVEHTVDSPEAVEDEMRYLLRVLSAK